MRWRTLVAVMLAGGAGGPACGGSDDFSLAVTNLGGGVVTSSPHGIDCGDTCEASFESDSIIRIEATPGVGHGFAGWVNGCGPSEECDLIAPSGSTLEVEAVFSSCEAAEVRCGIVCMAACRFATCGDGQLDRLEVCPGAARGYQGMDGFGLAGRPVTGDIDGDGDLDVAVNDSNTAALLLNGGDGAFTVERTPVLSPDQNVPAALIMADLDGVAGDELVSANWRDESVGIAARQPDASYLQELIAVSGSAADVAAIDLDGDADLDLVVYLVDRPGELNGLVLLSNDGSGGFSTPVEIASGLPSGINGITLADVNGDGARDLAFLADRMLQIAPGQDGKFGVPAAILETLEFALGDLDGDGDGDFIVLEFDEAGRSAIALVENLGAEGLAPPRTLLAAPSYRQVGFSSPALVDLDRDGALDLALIATQAEIGTSEMTRELLLLRNDGSAASFLGLAAFPGGQWAGFGDFQNDGAVDVAIFDTAGAEIHLSDP